MGRGGEESQLLCGLGSELRLGGREKNRAKIINGMEKNPIYEPGTEYLMGSHTGLPT